MIVSIISIGKRFLKEKVLCFKSLVFVYERGISMNLDNSPGHSNTRAQCTENEIGVIAPVRILIDWLGITFKSTDSTVLDLYHVFDFFENTLGIDRLWFKPGRKNYEGYADSFLFENINIYYNGAENQGIHVDFTGQGCRFLDYQFQKLSVQGFNVSNWYSFFDCLVEDERIKFTRLDVALDDFHGYLDVYKMFSKCLSGEITGKWRQWRPGGKFDFNGHTNGLSLYFGSEQSRIEAICYEKNKQLGLDIHWTRFELRFYKPRAEEMIKLILAFPDTSLGVHVAGVLKNYLCFRDKNENDSNKRRWPVTDWWDRFLYNVPPSRLASALPDRSVQRTKKWITNQVSRGIMKLFFAYQGIKDDWFQEIIQEGLLKLDESDYEQIQEFRRLFNKENTKLLTDYPIFTQKNNHSTCQDKSND